MKKPSVFIVILNWNGVKDTLECLQSINKLKISKYKLNIVIVDNASIDNSVEIIKKSHSELVSGSIVKLIQNEKNLGFAQGNNIGIHYAISHNADYIMVLNNDTQVDKSIIENFLKASKKYPKAGILSPKIYFAKGFEFHKKRYKKSDLGKVVWYAGGQIDWKNVYAKNFGVDTVDKGQFDKETEIDFATGACMFINVKALKKTDLFNKNYFLYLEDADLSLRMKKAGFKIIFTPKSFLWHKVSQSSAIGGGLNDYFLTRNRILFALKYAPLRAKIAVIKESIKFLFNGRPWQKKGVRDFYLMKFKKGSWKN